MDMSSWTWRRRADIAERPRPRADRGRFGIDTEFMSEGRYRALLCLVQVAVDDPEPGGDPLIYLIDSLGRGRRARRWPQLLGDPECRGRAARRPPGRGDPAPRLAHRAQQHLRHPDRRRVRRGQRPGGLRQPARLGARPPGRQDRQLHPLGRPAADRRAARLRGRGRGPPARAGRRAPAPADEPAAGWSGRARSAARLESATDERDPEHGLGAPAARRAARPAGPRGRPGAGRLARAHGLRPGPPGRLDRSPTRRWSSWPSAGPSTPRGAGADPRAAPADDQAPRTRRILDAIAADARRRRSPETRRGGARSPATRR